MSDYPSISDIIDALNALDVPRNSDRARAKDKLLDRLESLRALLPGLDVQRSRNFVKLMDRSVIFDVSDVKDIALPILFSLFVTIQREVFRSDDTSEIKRVMVVEEAHEVLSGMTDKRTADLKEGKPSSVLRDLRKTGASAVVVSQLVSDVARGVMGNLGSVFVLRQSNRDCVRQAAAALNLAPWQEAEIAKLPNRHAIARLSRYKEPVYLEVKDARALGLGISPTPSREEARERSRLVLEAIPYVKRGGLPTALAAEEGGPMATSVKTGNNNTSGGDVPAAEGTMSAREKKVLAAIAEWPFELIGRRADRLGLDRDSEGGARDGLRTRGLIEFAGKVGAKNVLVQLTARGRAVAERLGMTIAKTTKGSVVHSTIVQGTRESLGRFSTAFRFQQAGVSRTTSGVQPDLLLLTSGGNRIPIQACYMNQPSYEADALLKLHRLTQLDVGNANRVDFVLAIANSKGHKAAVQRALERANGGTMPGRVVLLDFDTITSPSFDWASVLEIPL